MATFNFDQVSSQHFKEKEEGTQTPRQPTSLLSLSRKPACGRRLPTGNNMTIWQRSSASSSVSISWNGPMSETRSPKIGPCIVTQVPSLFRPLTEWDRPAPAPRRFRYTSACTRLLAQYKTIMKLVGDAVSSIDAFASEYRVRPISLPAHMRKEIPLHLVIVCFLINMCQQKMDCAAALHRLKIGVPATVEHSAAEGVETARWIAETTQVLLAPFRLCLKTRSAKGYAHMGSPPFSPPFRHRPSSRISSRSWTHSSLSCARKISSIRSWPSSYQDTADSPKAMDGRDGQSFYNGNVSQIPNSSNRFCAVVLRILHTRLSDLVP
jgi:VPS28 protein